jgi:hypothetical protein
MHLQLLIPGLVWPEAMASCPQLPSLEILLARGRRARSVAADGRAWLYAAHDVTPAEATRASDPEQRDWPAAPFSLLADGGAPDGACWICADPVHLRLQRDALLLADASLLGLRREEADALVASLNAHFAVDGFELQALYPDRWYAKLQAMPELATTPLALAAGQSVDPNLPRGADAAIWHARMNEVQMLLHNHPVNEAREARNQMPVNSLWFWGAGALPVRDEDSPVAFSHVWATDPLARGLGLWSGALALDVPTSASILLEATPATGVGLVVLDGLEAARAYGDIGAWESRLREIESVWLAPLVAALREERIGMLSVHGFGDDKPFSVEAVRHDLKRFWRRAKPFSRQLG